MKNDAQGDFREVLSYPLKYVILQYMFGDGVRHLRILSDSLSKHCSQVCHDILLKFSPSNTL